MNLVTALLVTALVPTPAAPEYVAPEYVAIGDSYAAGVGADRDACGRNNNAYPPLYAAGRRARLVFAACGGATTAEVLGQAGRITTNTSLVTITVGGNDAGFADVMTTCVSRDDDTCVRRVEKAERFIRQELPGRLDTTFGAVRTSGKVVVLGYPRLFETSRACSVTVVERQALNRIADLLNEALADGAKAAGFTFGDVRDVFAGHGACGSDPWINDLSFPTSDSFHPNATGHRNGYLRVLSDAAG